MNALLALVAGGLGGGYLVAKTIATRLPELLQQSPAIEAIFVKALQKHNGPGWRVALRTERAKWRHEEHFQSRGGDSERERLLEELYDAATEWDATLTKSARSMMSEGGFDAQKVMEQAKIAQKSTNRLNAAIKAIRAYDEPKPHPAPIPVPTGPGRDT